MAAVEKHFTVQQVVDLWGYSTSMIRKMFSNEDGVLRVGHAETRFRRKRFHLRIPESVLMRVHQKMIIRK